MSKRQIFNITYRYIIPVGIVLAFALLPDFRFSIHKHHFFEWIMCLMVAAPYPVVTTLDQVPSKEIPFWKRGIWQRHGVFHGDQFLTYYDRTAIPFFYILYAVGLPLILGLWIVAGPPFFSNFATTDVRIIAAVVNFVLLIIPFIHFYPAFMKAVYP